MELYIADTLERLLSKLQSQLASHSDPLRPPRLLVPNRNLRRWMQMQLANSQGVAANLNFQYLEQGISSVLSAGLQSRQASAGLQQWALIQALQTDPSIDPSLGSAPDSLELYRRSAHLTYLFRDYEYHRNPMIRSWQKELSSSPTTFDSDIFGLEETFSLEENHHFRTQKKLYCSMLEKLHSAGFLGFSELAGLALERGEFTDDPLYVFGLSRMSRLHLSLLFRLSLHFPVRIFLFDVFSSSLTHPQGTEWEQIDPPVFQTRKEDESLQVLHRNLSEQEYSFQRDGQELLFLFRKGQSFLESKGSYLLWHRYPGSKSAGVLKSLGPDTSLKIVEAPGMRKEVEFIHDDILIKLRDDDSLKPEDIGILVPTMHRYRAHFEYVFGGRNQLPFNLTDFSARETSRLGDALRTLLKFDQPLDRRNVFHLLANPMIRKKWGFQSEDYQSLLQKVDELNIFRGSSDTVFPVHSWKHGLRRLRLSDIMVGRAGPFQGYQPAPRGIFEPDLFGRLWDFIEQLESFRKELKHSDDPFTVIRELIQTFVSIKDHRKESRIYLSLMESLQSAREECKKIGFIPAPLMAREWVLESLKEVAGGIGEYLIQGVTISALQPMRPIPFRHLYIAGLKEGDFPGFPLSHPEDLRRQFRLPGDSSLPDGNRFLFLEAISSYEDSLTLSYVGRDLARDDEYQPSSVILELEDFLKREKRQLLPYLWISREYNNSEILDPLHVKVLRERWFAETQSSNPVPEKQEPSALFRKSFKPHQLVRLFTEPLRAFLEFKLNAYPLRQEDASDVSDEPYRLIPGHRNQLKYLMRDLAAHFLGSSEAYRKLLETLYQDLISRGAAPAGYFADLDYFTLDQNQPYLSLENQTFIDLVADDGAYISSMRPDLRPLPFMQLESPYSIRGMEFHFSIPYYSNQSRRFIVPAGNALDSRTLIGTFMSLLFFALQRNMELKHEVCFLKLSGEGKLEVRQLSVGLDEMKEMAEYLCDELQIYGPLMFHDLKEGDLSPHRMEELLLDSWQELQESTHPVLGMVMEKLDASRLMELIMQSGSLGADSSEFERRVEMRTRIEEVWQ